MSDLKKGMISKLKLPAFFLLSSIGLAGASRFVVPESRGIPRPIQRIEAEERLVSDNGGFPGYFIQLTQTNMPQQDIALERRLYALGLGDGVRQLPERSGSPQVITTYAGDDLNRARRTADHLLHHAASATVLTPDPSDPKRMVAVYRKTIDDLIAQERKSLGPREHLSHLAEKWGAHYGVDDSYVKTVISIESDFNPGLRGYKLKPAFIKGKRKFVYALDRHGNRIPSGAVGAMQVKPETASWILKEDVDSQDLLDPDLNVRAGTAFLAHLLKSYNGNFVRTLAAYNAGPNGDHRSAQPRAYVARGVKALEGFAGSMPGLP